MSFTDTPMATKTAKAPALSKACRQLFVDLSAYSDGELDGKAKDVVEQHLMVCEQCRHQLDEMIRLRFLYLRAALATPGVRRGRSVIDLLKEKRDEELSGGKKKEPLVS